VLDKAQYSAFESTLNSPIVSYRILCPFYNCSVFIYSTVGGRKCEVNIIVIVNECLNVNITELYVDEKQTVIVFMNEFLVKKITDANNK